MGYQVGHQQIYLFSGDGNAENNPSRPYNLKEQLISQWFLSENDDSSYGINSDLISAFGDLPDHVIGKPLRRPSM